MGEEIKIKKFTNFHLAKDKNKKLFDLFVNAEDINGREKGTIVTICYDDLTKFINMYEKLEHAENMYDVYGKDFSIGMASITKSFIPLKTNPYFEYCIYVNSKGGTVDKEVIESLYHEALNITGGTPVKNNDDNVARGFSIKL